MKPLYKEQKWRKVIIEGKPCILCMRSEHEW